MEATDEVLTIDPTVGQQSSPMQTPPVQHRLFVTHPQYDQVDVADEYPNDPSVG